MLRRKLTRSIAVVATLSLVAAACGGDDSNGGASAPSPDGTDAPTEPTGPTGDDDGPDEPDPEPSNDGDADARRGGELTIARVNDTQQLDPLEAVQTETIYVLNMMMETLLFTAPGGGTMPGLATSAEALDDEVTWRVSLREGVLFSDGSPFTADDVKFTFDRARGADVGFSFMLDAFVEANVVDELTIDLVTAEPITFVPALLALWSGAIIPDEFGGLTEEEFFENPIGTGPFVLDEWNPGQSIRLVRNDNYWQEGKPYLDSVVWTQVADDNARVIQLRGGQADIISAVPFASIAELDAEPGLSVTEWDSTLQFYLMFNFTVEPFDDPDVRRAIAYAIDREAIVRAGLFGSGAVACTILPPTMLHFAPDVECLPHDPELAAVTLAQSSVPDGFDTELLIAGTNVLASTAAEIIVENLRPLGINVEISRVDGSQLYSTQTTGGFEMVFQGWGSDIPDPDQQITFMVDPVSGGVESYWTFYDNPEMTALVESARREFDDDARAAIYAEIQALHLEDLPHIPLVFQPNPFAQSDRVQGFQVLPTGNYFIQDVWLED